MKCLLFLCLLPLLGCTSFKQQEPYQPNWESLDSRPLPSWYDQSKIGIFLHWGAFSSPSFGSEWFWWYLDGEKKPEYLDFMKKNYKPNTTYQDLASDFSAEFFDPIAWAETFNASGARYVVLTSKHHEGFTMWPSDVSFSWNAMDIGPNRDLVGDLANAVRIFPNLRFGLYHSLFEWFNPLYLRDKASGFQRQDFIQRKTMPELYELVERYKPDVIWSDGEGEASSTYWNSTHFLAWLYNESPVKDTVVTNDRWGNETACKHGGFYSCMDRYNPGKLVNHKWENAMTIDKHSWGHRREAKLEDYLTAEELISTLVETVSCGGNLLVNVGPTKDGRIIPIFDERLRQMGQWLGVNGEAIYGSVPWKFQNDTVTKGVWYTSQLQERNTPRWFEPKVTVYAILVQWPRDNKITLGAVTNPEAGTIVTMLGDSGKLTWTTNSNDEMVVNLPRLNPDLFKGDWAWTLKIEPDSYK